MKPLFGLLLALASQLWAAPPVPLTLPLAFEPSEKPGFYLAHAANLGLALDPRGATLQLQSGRRLSTNTSTTLRVTFAHASVSTLETLEPLASRANYFPSSDPRQWRRDVPQFGRVRYRELYKNTDLVFYGNSRLLEYDWILHPGSNPSDIRMSFSGVKALHIDAAGDLILSTPSGELRQLKPKILQEGREIHGKFVLRGTSTIGFEVAAYDPSKDLTIDPVLTYSTYIGGQDGDTIYSIAYDPQGNVIVGGATLSPNFPVRSSVLGPPHVRNRPRLRCQDQPQRPRRSIPPLVHLHRRGRQLQLRSRRECRRARQRARHRHHRRGKFPAGQPVSEQHQ